MERIMGFLRDLESTTPYAPWTPPMGFTTGPPFWLNDTLPRIEEIREGGLNCLGLINLVSLFSGSSARIAWFQELDARGLLKSFDRTKDDAYPPGTLLLRPYHDQEYDQGHYAIVVGSGDDVVHAFARIPEGKTFAELIRSGEKLQPGVVIESVELSDEWFSGGTYTHVCAPSDWIHLDEEIRALQAELQAPLQPTAGTRLQLVLRRRGG